ncbi:MAG: type II toxin-antitoxin system RelE/ParE family toxin [Candidatus Aenigmarchaeota archaeon]|nr:type II toxin-antitoxin system RelE/ParE family toxin [Candidatus Aenigmarchaeota archaeon]
MIFVAEYSNQALKLLKQADKILAKRVIAKVELLLKEPVGHDAKIMEGYKEKLYRVRVGDYRILYEVDYGNKKIGVVKIDHRSKVYR